MARVLLGTFIILHGLVHVGYIVLSQKWVAFRPEMGWSGRSWLFTPLLGDPAARAAAAIIYALAGLGLVVGGIIGWLASIVMKTNAQMGVIANVVVGVVGALIGGWISTQQNLGGGGIVSFILAVIGAAVLIWILKVLKIFK